MLGELAFRKNQQRGEWGVYSWKEIKSTFSYLSIKLQIGTYRKQLKDKQATGSNVEINQDDYENDGENSEERFKYKKRIELWDKYIDQFSRSMAGSVVASYILDLGDRHSGNLLIKEDAWLIFHIDFGHILGHKKSKFGFKREVEPFIYLEEMHQLITFRYADKERSRKNFENFQEYCCEGFKIARENFVLFLDLLTLIVPANIQEIDKESITKTIKQYQLNLSDNEAKFEMREMIKKAHKVYRRQFDNWFRLQCDWTKSIKSKWYFKCICFPVTSIKKWLKKKDKKGNKEQKESTYYRYTIFNP